MIIVYWNSPLTTAVWALLYCMLAFWLGSFVIFWTALSFWKDIWRMPSGIILAIVLYQTLSVNQMEPSARRFRVKIFPRFFLFFNFFLFYEGTFSRSAAVFCNPALAGDLGLLSIIPLNYQRIRQKYKQKAELLRCALDDFLLAFGRDEREKKSLKIRRREMRVDSLESLGFWKVATVGRQVWGVLKRRRQRRLRIRRQVKPQLTSLAYFIIFLLLPPEKQTFYRTICPSKLELINPNTVYRQC